MQETREEGLERLLEQALNFLNAIEEEHGLRKCPGCNEDLNSLLENVHEFAQMLRSATDNEPPTS